MSACINCDALAFHETGGDASEPMCRVCKRCWHGECHECAAEKALAPDAVLGAFDAFDRLDHVLHRLGLTVGENQLRRIGSGIAQIDVFCGDLCVMHGNAGELWDWLHRLAAPKRQPAVAP